MLTLKNLQKLICQLCVQSFQESGPKVAILDAGSQYGKLIDKEVRKLNVHSEIFPIDVTFDELMEQTGGSVEAIMITGGPDSVGNKFTQAFRYITRQELAPRMHESVVNSDLHRFGSCYGMQLMNYEAGGKARKLAIREDGPTKIHVTSEDSVLFQGIPETFIANSTHGDSVTPNTVGKGFRVTAMSENGLVAAIENPETNECGTQFHFETTDITEHGAAFISNFLDKAGIERDFTPEDREEQAIAYIREQVGDKKVLCLVSGGVDSTVLARLLAKALKPEQLLLVHVDNGFMREGESSEVVEEFEKIKMKVEVILAQQEFANATTEIDGVEVGPLKETIDPEHKRKIIGDTFMRITDQKILKLVEEKGWKIDDVMIAQGTLRPDLIESASKMVSGKATTIKTHHNDTPLVRQKREAGMILEPLKDFHKDEVRELGERLGLFRKLVWRQPFPGPGLAIRMICAAEAFIGKTFDSTNELLTQLTNYDRTEYEGRNNIFSNLFTGWKRKINRFVKGNLNTEATKEMLESIAGNINATLLPIKTVGVQGDGRTYSYAATLSGEKDWDKLQYLAKAIPSLSHDINRVVYELGEEDKIVDDVTEITPTYPTEKPIEKVRKATKVVDDVLEKYDLMEKLAQVPVVLVPLPFGKEGNHSIVIRTFMTETFMVGRPAIPGKDIPEEALQEMYEGIMEIPGISKVFYDLTGKPPATTEWE